MILDCETPLGKEFIKHQYNTESILSRMGYTFINTPKKDSFLDALIAKDINGVLTLCGIAEIKSRRMAGENILTVDYLKNNGGYLITNEKLKYGQSVSKFMSVPFYLIVNLIEDKSILIWQITNNNGLFEFEFETKNTSTKMTCNGGIIVRENSYLPVENVKQIILY